MIYTSILRFRHELMSWYVSRANRYPFESLSRVADFTPKMAGGKSEQACKTNGGGDLWFTASCCS